MCEGKKKKKSVRMQDESDYFPGFGTFFGRGARCARSADPSSRLFEHGKRAGISGAFNTRCVRMHGQFWIAVANSRTN